MKKLLLSFACILGLTASAAVFELDMSQTGQTSWDNNPWLQEGFTLVAKKNGGNTAPTVNAKNGDLRLYAKNTLTITSDTPMTEISFALSTQGVDRSTEITVSTGKIEEQGANPLVWKGEATSVTFTVGDKAVYGKDKNAAGQFCFTTITITTTGQGAAVSSVVFNPGAGKVFQRTAVTLMCATEGAEIHYAIDEGPDAESPIYTQPIILTESCTIQAIAIKDGQVSNVSSASYEVLDPMESLAANYELKNNDIFQAGYDATVVYVNGLYCYIFDGESYGLIYGETSVEAGDIIAAGWTGTVSVYNSLKELKPTSDLVVKGKGTIPAPILIDADNFETMYVAANQNMLVRINGVEVNVETAEDGKASYTATADGNDIAIYNRFNMDITSGTYDIVALMSVYKTDVQIYPIELIVAGGIQGDVNGDGEVSVTDITELINCLLGEANNPRADVNNDGQVTVTDVTELINLMLN